jgi:hypothetical protein
LAAGAILAMQGASAPAQAQGLFDFLFGGGAFYAPAPQYAHPAHARQSRLDAERARVQRARLREVRIIDEPRKPRPHTPPQELAGPLGKFLMDHTLRRGDVVATQNGLMVFRGSGAGPHRERDFAPVSTAQGPHRATLIALDKTLRQEQPLHESTQVAVAPAGAPAVGPALVASVSQSAVRRPAR